MAEEGLSNVAARLQGAEEALQRCERLAVANRYAGAIMHEVNNPLEALTNLVYVAQMISGEEKVKDILQIAEAQLKRLREITRKSLDFYRDEQEAREFDLIEIAESALTTHRYRIREQKVELRRKVRSPAPAKVFAGEMLQVLSNLILNSLDAVSEEEAVLCVRVRTCPKRVHITISDNGSGIEPAIYERLFEANRSTKTQGTGVGLWLSKTIVEKHGGTILCRSSQKPEHRGTTFRICLPLATQSGKAA